MGNFQITAVEDGKKYWISRSMATRSELVVFDNNGNYYLLINKRGIGTPDFQGCWNIPCGYLEYDVTTKENATKELLEETKVYIPHSLWYLIGIEDNPKRGDKQNVTVVYRCAVSKDYYDRALALGVNMENGGGEKDEVDDIWLMPLTVENINSIEWAFNHKDVAFEILKNIKL